MTEKLDLYDYKLLHELDENSRKSASAIGKKIRLSKVSINKRIKRLQNKGIINNFMIQVNYRKLGYTTCHAFYKLQNISSQDESRFYVYLSNHRLIGYVARIDGNFDTYVVLLYKNNDDIEMVLSEINQQFGIYIKERIILPVVNAKYFGRRYLIKSELIPQIKREKEGELVELDKINYSLLQVISQNARIPIIHLAEKLKITKDIAHYRIKKLIKEGILQKFTLNLNHEKFGNSFYKILINLNYEKDENKFLSKISVCQNLIRSIKVIGSWDLELDFEVNNVQEIRAILKELKEVNGEYLRDYNSMFIYKIDKLNYFPF